ncbi:cell division cycle protein 23 homolog [Anthonomus grandis grandis]|uniref:cell division cycle protein 23 homolog n=1 Tax=Anthonomus grandis grandis TaxID=2921223 RepID=UPI0021668C4E|nr:cell division cycle protein 23 homolog [Anthonomus grandis grandis]
MNDMEIELDFRTIKIDLLKGIYNCSERGLTQSLKWLTELNFAVDQVELMPEDIPDLRDDCGDEHARFLMAKSYFNLKEYDRCAYFLKDCVTPKPRFLYFFAKYYAIEKKKLDSMTDTNCPPDPSNNESLKTLYSELKNDFYENKLDGYCLYLYGVVLKKLDLKSLAVDALIKAVQDEPMLWSAWFELGKLTCIKKTDTTAISNKLPDHWMKYFFWAHAYLEQLNNDGALRIYERFCDLGLQNSTYIMSQIALGHHNNRELDDAIEMFTKILVVDPYRLDNLDTYSNLLYVLERKTELANLAHKAVDIDKYRVETCCVIGNYYSLRSDHAKAVLYFKRALKLNPQFLSAWTLMGHEYMEMKNTNAAIESYRRAIEINERDYRAWYGLGQTYEILKMPSYCLYYYKRAQELKPNDSRMLIAMGETYEKLNKPENALKCYYKAYKVGDVEGLVLVKLAKLYDKLDDKENAAAVLLEFCLNEIDKGDNLSEERTEYYNSLLYLANYFFGKGDFNEAYTYSYKCMESEETKEQAKALLKAIAAKRAEQGQEMEGHDATFDPEMTNNQSNNDASDMDLTT